ncbi:MAG: hypothetical protein AAGA54_31405 [Myxococcota bacterium]
MSPLAGAAGAALAIVTAQPLLPPEGSVQVVEVPPVAPGADGELSVTILQAPMSGVPLELRLQAEGVRVVENRLGWSSVVDPLAQQPRLRTRFVAPAEPGRYVVRGLLRYVTCDEDDTCLPHVVSVSWVVEVEPPPEPL